MVTSRLCLVRMEKGVKFFFNLIRSPECKQADYLRSWLVIFICCIFLSRRYKGKEHWRPVNSGHSIWRPGWYHEGLPRLFCRASNLTRVTEEPIPEMPANTVAWSKIWYDQQRTLTKAFDRKGWNQKGLLYRNFNVKGFQIFNSSFLILKWYLSQDYFDYLILQILWFSPMGNNMYH